MHIFLNDEFLVYYNLFFLKSTGIQIFIYIFHYRIKQPSLDLCLNQTKYMIVKYEH
jgi:hypothetical protein